MGLNSGIVVVGSIGDNLRMDYSAIGDTTNLAARLQQGAEPDTVLVSESTSRLVQGYIRLEPVPPIEVKGKTEPVSIYKVVGTLPRRSPIVSRGERTLSPFVGREREAFGHHRWRWKMKLCIGLAELSYMTGEYDQALRSVDEGLQEAQRTSSQKYVALGWALRGKIIAKLGDAHAAGTELQRAFSLADQLQSPSKPRHDILSTSGHLSGLDF